jgi:hypothetical protein
MLPQRSSSASVEHLAERTRRVIPLVLLAPSMTETALSRSQPSMAGFD